VYAGAEDGEDDGGEGEQEKAADVAAALDLFRRFGGDEGQRDVPQGLKPLRE